MAKKQNSAVFVCAVVVAAVLGIGSGATAAPIVGTVLVNPGDTVFPGLIPPGTDEGALLASIVSPYSFLTSAGTTSGTLSSAVFVNPSGTLDFYYQVSNDASSATEIARETSFSFSGFDTWLGFRIDGSTLAGALFADGTVAPVTADRDASGSVVGFSFVPPDAAKILPGLTSSVLVISTNATLYTVGGASLIDGGTQTVSAFQPFATVPEPASLLLLGTGLALSLARRARKA